MRQLDLYQYLCPSHLLMIYNTSRPYGSVAQILHTAHSYLISSSSIDHLVPGVLTTSFLQEVLKYNSPLFGGFT